MTDGDIIAFAALTFTVISGFSVVMYKFSSVETKVSILWRLFEANAGTEAITKSFMKRNSPLSPTVKAIESFQLAELYQDLQEFYKKTGYKLDDLALAGEIMKQFGERIKSEIAEPFNLHSGADIVTAMKIAKGLPMEKIAV